MLNSTLKYLVLFLLVLNGAFFSATSLASTYTLESKPLDELWVNFGFYSYHFQKDIDLNNSNPGLGLEYRYSTVNSLTAGRFHNSDNQISSYAALYWQPFELGDIRVGALIGAINGYPKASNGDWFPLVLPVASYEYKNLGISLTFIPTYKDMLHGSISMQLKLKAF